MKSKAKQNKLIAKKHESADDQSQSHIITEEKNLQKNPQYEIFGTAALCIDHIKASDNKNLYMFAEDKDVEMSKRYIATTWKHMCKLSLERKHHFYEYMMREDQIKLFIDIDLKPHQFPKNITKENRMTYFNEIINQCLNLTINQLKKHDIENPMIILLKSNGEEKYSVHAIFLDVIFADVYALKFFISDINSQLIRDGIFDVCPYKTGGLRLFGNSKFGSNRFLEFYKGINYKYTNDEQLFMDCLLRNIPKKHQFVDYQVPVNVKIVPKKKPIKKNNQNNKHIEINEYDEDKLYIPVCVIAKYLNMIDSKLNVKYPDWIKIAFSMHGANPTEKCFDLFDKWSQQSEKYNCRDYNAKLWNSFKFGSYSIGTLKYFAKLHNPDAYEEFEYGLEKDLFVPITYTSNYLLNNEKENILDNKSEISKHIIQWAYGPEKSCGIHAVYNTGKTKIINKTVVEFGFKKVLIVSYRQTLTNEFHGNFKSLGFESYLDKDYEVDRLICQVESLPKLLDKDGYDFIDDEEEIPSYDLVIIDEIESVLSHFRSPTIDRKEGIFNLLKDIIYNSRKLLVLDGDFGNRSYNFIRYFGDHIVVHNTIRKDFKHWIFSNNRDEFELLIEIALSKGKKVVIVSMSSKIATYFADKYKSRFKVVVHTSKSNDKDKENLKNVNEYWIQYEIVIYSPTIESGVNFDKPHFDQIFVILSSKSTSPRGLLQMSARVRKLTNNNVHVYLNNMPFREKANFFTWDEINEYVNEVHQKQLSYETVLNPTTNKMVMKYKHDLYSQNLVYNELENANKSLNFFVPYLLQLLKNKGHTYEYSDVKLNHHAYKKDTLLKNEILNALDVSTDQFNYLMVKQMNNNATREDKVNIERYVLKKDWKIDEVTDDFLKKYYGKTDTLYNLRYLMDVKVIDPYTGKVLEYDNVKKLRQIKMIKEIISLLGYEKPGDGKKITREEFIENIKDVKSDSKFFTNQLISLPLFGYSKKSDGERFNKLKDIKKFMGAINSLFSEWGIKIMVKQKNKKIKSIVIKENYYILTFTDNINQYL